MKFTDGLACSKKYADDISPQHETEATGIVVKNEPSSFNDSNVPDDDMFAEETVSPSSATKPSHMKLESTSIVATAAVVNLNVSPSSHVKISTESECTELCKFCSIFCHLWIIQILTEVSANYYLIDSTVFLL